jgi:periplasmic protein TonB
LRTVEKHMAEYTPPSDNLSNAQEDKHLANLVTFQVDEPFYRSLFQSIKDLIHPPKLPPLQVTSKPIPVKDIWGLYGRKNTSFAMSTGFQIFVVALAFTVFSSKTVRDKVREVIPLIAPVDLEPYQPKTPPKNDQMHGGGGGGDRSPLPAAKGRLPKPALRQFTPPTQVFNNPNPKLAMEPTIIAPPDMELPQVNMQQYGDPLAKLGPPSNGPGSGGGIGSGSGGGVGPGNGGGYGPGSGGGAGGGVYKIGGGVSRPEVLFKVEPEYSEEARKAKYQGVVILYVEIDPSGKATNIRVTRSLGLGLDEKAMEAVKKWKFKPGMMNGKAVTVAASIEVNFRLL